MVNGDDQMTFNPESYKLNRKAVIPVVENYFNKLADTNLSNAKLLEIQETVLELNYHELLIIQSSIECWEKLMYDPDVNFRRMLCLKLFNLKQVNIMQELGISDGAASNLFNKATMPDMPRPFQLSILFNHPYQLINLKNPVKDSFRESPEYFYHGVSKSIGIKELPAERTNVTSIRGYVITDPQVLFNKESDRISGRWVTTYHEFDYFEFHLNNEPLIDKELRKRICELFPQAKHLVTTFLPFKRNFRSLWVIIPKGKSRNSYIGILHELKVYRDQTECHSLL